jgi:glycosyltransferase involved in cell wall biosynthesis
VGDRIAYNALALRPGGTGVQTYIRELLRALVALGEPAGVQFVATVQADAAAALPAGVEARLAPVSAGLRRALRGLRSLGAAQLVHGLDVDLPPRPGAPAVTTVHDMAVFDVPELLSRRKAIGERVLYRQAIARADAVITDSAFTAERLKALLGRDSTVVLLGAPVDLAPPTPDAVASVRARLGLPDVFALHVGTIEARKDLVTVADACRTRSIPFLLAGPVAPGNEVPAGATRLGYVDRADLAPLYGAATVVAFPSRYEGFGLTPLEAMACGAPVVAAEASALPEVLGAAAMYVRPGDVDAWGTAIAGLAADADRRAEMASMGLERVAALTWQQAAAGTAAVYRSLGITI